jgi:hypothetical protein
LIDKGKVDVKDVALEIGISPDTLAANINVMLEIYHVHFVKNDYLNKINFIFMLQTLYFQEAYMAPDVQHKIFNWLKAHVYTGASHKSLKVKVKPANVSINETGASNGFDTSQLSDSGLLDPVAVNVKSVPPRRRTINNIRILKDNKVICSSEGVTTSENGVSIDKFLVCQPECESPGRSDKASIPDAIETVILLPGLFGLKDIFYFYFLFLLTTNSSKQCLVLFTLFYVFQCLVLFILFYVL